MTTGHKASYEWRSQLVETKETSDDVNGLAEEKRWDAKPTCRAHFSLMFPSEKEKVSGAKAEKTKWRDGLSKNFQSQNWPS